MSGDESSRSLLPVSCEVIDAEFVFGPHRCGRTGWHTLPDSDGIDRGVCDGHLAEYRAEVTTA